jgi:hypothetical protein
VLEKRMIFYSKANFIIALSILLLMLFEAIFFYDESYKVFFLQKNDYLPTMGKIIKNKLYINHIVSSSKQLLMVKYKYNIHGRDYHSTRIVAGGIARYMSDDEISGYYYQFPTGKVVDIYYLPENPSFSVLDPDNRHYTTLIVRFFIFLINIFLMLYGKYGTFHSLFEKKKK